jgi:hypothetical protein
MGFFARRNKVFVIHYVSETRPAAQNVPGKRHDDFRALLLAFGAIATNASVNGERDELTG